MGVSAVRLRRWAMLGARFGPDWWVKRSPAYFGWLFAGLMPEQRRWIRRNLEALGVGGRFASWQLFAEYAACLAEGLALSAGRPVTPKVEVLGAEHLEQALSGARGVILVTGHIGPWDAAGPLLVQHRELSVSFVMRREPDPEARALHDALREQAGVHVVHIGEHPLEALKLRKCLGPGRALAFQLDRSAERPPGLVERIPEGPFRLASVAGVPVVPVFAARRGYFDYQLRVGPIEHLPRRPSSSEFEACLGRVKEQLNAWILQHPTQWFDFVEQKAPTSVEQRAR